MLQFSLFTKRPKAEIKIDSFPNVGDMTVRGQHEVRGGGGVGQRGHLVQWFLARLQSNITLLHVPQRATQGGGRGGHRVVLPARAGRQLQVVLAATDDDADAVVYGIAHLAPDGRLGVSLCV